MKFAREEPDLVPRWCGASPEFIVNAKRQLGIDDTGQLFVRFGDDFRRVFARDAGPTEFSPDGDLSEGATYRTIFGLLRGDWSPFWHDAIDLFGMENLYLKFYDEPEVVEAVVQHIVDYYAEVSRRIFDAAADVIDVFFIGNDFGGQTGPLLSPAQFNRFMLPHLKRLIDLGHAYRLKVQLHCRCGMDLAKKANYGGKILFNGAIDSHHVLIDGTPESVRHRTREVLAIMAPGGGYIAGASHDYILEETPVENVVAMFDTIAEYRL